ncbi:hypothetical protein AOQ84DRAFT_390292 [Glonium stellatum]|uniref:Uncharacterized protein n=1 Tax=Glonium stellatum TaxID=574774 RepID=A0A8E2EWQ1_9PEZI|nr:hypothetical protein AOQ84DRAFT_390292 [Glonium stellatum]
MNQYRDLPPHYPGNEYDITLPKPGTLSPQSNPVGVLSDAIRSVATDSSSLQLPPISSDEPPGYAPLDVLANNFTLSAPLIYATRTSNTPRYQLYQEFTKSGKPSKLHIRRLLPSESRAHSLPSGNLQVLPRISYDEDGTMYTISEYDMRGLRESTLRGIIKIEQGSGLRGRYCKFWHLTKNAANDMLRSENEAKMQKYGYHVRDEWNKDLLFCIKKGKWKDDIGDVVAIEQDMDFKIQTIVNGMRRDLLVACWVARIWFAQGLRWEES